MSTVRIWDLSSRVDVESLKTVMSHFGTVLDCRVVKGSNDNAQANAFVTFDSEESAKNAAAADKKLECGSCPLRIELYDGAIGDDVSSMPQSGCWFCLANESCQLHMVSYVFDYCYLTIAKGALNKFHCIISSIDHLPNLITSPPAIREDIKYAVDVALKIIAKEGHGAIAFERYMPMSLEHANHLQVQVAAVPIDTAHFGINFVRRCKYIKSEPVAYSKFLDKIPDKISDKQSYFLLHQYGRPIGSNKISEKCYIWTIDKDRRIPVNFGREVIVQLMEETDLKEIKSLGSQSDVRSAAVDWHNCIAPDEEEEKQANVLMSMIKRHLKTA